MINLNKDNLAAILGIVVIGASITVIIFGIRLSGDKEQVAAPQESVTEDQAEKPPSGAPSSAEGKKDKEGNNHQEPEEDGDKVSPPEQELPLQATSSGGSSVVLGPAGPAPVPEEEDITRVSIASSECEPQEIKKVDDKEIILEVTAEDGDYSFHIKGSPIREEVKKGESKKLSFPASILDSDKMIFECRSLQESEQ